MSANDILGFSLRTLSRLSFKNLKYPVSGCLGAVASLGVFLRFFDLFLFTGVTLLVLAFKDFLSPAESALSSADSLYGDLFPENSSPSPFTFDGCWLAVIIVIEDTDSSPFTALLSFSPVNIFLPFATLCSVNQAYNSETHAHALNSVSEFLKGLPSHDENNFANFHTDNGNRTCVKRPSNAERKRDVLSPNGGSDQSEDVTVRRCKRPRLDLNNTL
ncbi:Protein of unknown function [Cotesia congregata]|uniref:DET1- and DDB1-associated protein 1 domain-containing protein n=1 Tax=Cotesia congregata TaxID=51543 RepID=A0A8J2MLM6_COTCN|nr:Protein of unknown function [Cotesia congregata]